MKIQRDLIICDKCFHYKSSNTDMNHYQRMCALFNYDMTEDDENKYLDWTVYHYQTPDKEKPLPRSCPYKLEHILSLNKNTNTES